MLRHDLGYTGTHLGCEHGICGACTVILDGAPVRACLVFGVQADGAEVRTVEGLADGEQLSDLQQAFSDHHALQCGFCTPGFLMLAEAYLAETTSPKTPRRSTEEQARELVAANLCRCTGYQGIIEAIAGHRARPPAKPADEHDRHRCPAAAPGRPPPAARPRPVRRRHQRPGPAVGPGRPVPGPRTGRSAGSTSPRPSRPPGVVAVVTAEDLPQAWSSRSGSPSPAPTSATSCSRCWPADTVRYVGEPLAVVVGDDPYACEDAAELVEIDIADKPAVLDARKDPAPGSRPNSPAATATPTPPSPPPRTSSRSSSPSAATAACRSSPAACWRCPAADRGALDIFGMTKVPVWNRDLLADMLGLDETLIRVHAIDAGGGFGVRGEFYPEDFLIPWLAIRDWAARSSGPRTGPST